MLLAYHDAGWANAPQSVEDPFYQLTEAENQAGLVCQGPHSYKGKKLLKKTNSKLASQYGMITFLADNRVVNGQISRLSVLDWRSHAGERVCRSTFGAETMSCAEALESVQYLRSFMESLLSGKLTKTDECTTPVRMLTDCRSLYDHLSREGIPRLPREKRLALDLACIRQALRDELQLLRLAWLPTEAQLADILTKPMRAGAWWETVNGSMALPFTEG